MLDGVGNGASIELPDGLKDGALEWFYRLRGGDRVMLRRRDSHSGGWTTQECTFEGRHPFLKPIVRGCLGEENTGNRVFCRKQCRTQVERTNECLTVLGTRRTGAYLAGQTLVQSPDFRQTAPGIRWLSRVCDRVCGVSRPTSPKTVKHPRQTRLMWFGRGLVMMDSTLECARSPTNSEVKS
jgi:hypothetical protein